MKRVLVASLKQETSTFNPVRSKYDDFAILRGREILDSFTNTSTEIAGALEMLSQSGDVRIIPCYSAQAVPGGPVEEKSLERIRQDLLSSIQDNLPADGVLLILHGAMAGVSEPDPEGSILSEVRELIGNKPIVASLDMHAVLTDRMLQACEVMVPFHTYPHTDHLQTGRRAARCLLRLLRGEGPPEPTRIRIPLLVRGDQLLTASGLLGKVIDECREIEISEGAFSAGILIGNPFTDVPELTTNVLVYRIADRERARNEAERMARFLWENRNSFFADLTPLDEAVGEAKKLLVASEAQQGGSEKRTVVFSDAADATSSGAPGDSSAVLQGLIEHDYSGRSLSAVVDAPAVAKAVASGVGTDLDVSLGGSLDPGRQQPLHLQAHVKSLSDGVFLYENGTAGRAGRAAVLEHQNHTVLVTERPVYIVGQGVYRCHGLDPANFDLVVVKSPNGFRPYYASIAKTVFCVDVPGATSADLRSLPYSRVKRPVFPLDEAADFAV